MASAIKFIWQMLIFAVVGIGGAYFLSPYWAAWKVASAIKNENPLVLAEYVDFQALTENLKAGANRYVETSMQKATGKSLGKSENEFLNLGMEFLAGMVKDGISSVAEEKIDAAVTPENWPRLLGAALKNPRGQNDISDSSMDWSTSYQDPDTFVVRLKQKGSRETMRLKFLRVDNFLWQLSAAELPNSVWDRQFNQALGLN